MFTKVLVLATVSSVALGACKRGYFKYAAEVDAAEFQIMEFEACEGYMGGGQAYSYVYECGKDQNNATDDTKYVWDKSYNTYECSGDAVETTRVGAIGDLDDATWVAHMQARFGAYFSLYDETQTSCGGDKCWVKYEMGSSTPEFNGSSCDNTAYYQKVWLPIGECYYGEQYTCTSSSLSYANCTGNTVFTVVDEGCFTANENTTDETSLTFEMLYCGASAHSVIAAALAALIVSAFVN
jgi:hypothetical protein